MSDTDIVERSKRTLAFWGDKAMGYNTILIRELVAECERLRSGRAAVWAECKEECAKVADTLASNASQLRLHAGEMTQQELRTAQAVLILAAVKIRARSHL